MMDNIDEVTDVRLKALKKIERKTRLELPRHITRKSNLPSGRIRKSLLNTLNYQLVSNLHPQL
jgi:hypothetical protein